MGDNRKTVLLWVILGLAIIYAFRLFYLQVLDTTYIQAANSNSLQKMIDYPYRGLIYDRKGKILVYNVPVFDINVTPREVPKNLDTARLADLFKIPRQELDSLLIKAKKYSRVKPSTIIKQMSSEEMGAIQDQLVDFPGFTISPRTVRGYPHQSMANALGYIGEISKRQLDQSAGYYKQGDYIGLSGLEKEYENELRGQRGVKYVMVDVHGVKKGAFRNGAFDTSSQKGADLYSSIDLELQQYGEKLMVNKAGSIVAIEPSTGEILAFVSAPSYDPNMLSGREYSRNFSKLLRDSLKPLFNRGLMAMYRPGSTFKTVQSAIALQMGVIDSSTTLFCNKGIIKCHGHPGSHLNMTQAIQWSCNPYFHQLYRRMLNRGYDNRNTFRDTYIGYQKWRDYVMSMGLGAPLGVDLPNEKKGIIPTTKFYDRWYGHMRWKFSTIYSLSIGEGELGILPIQLANLACIYANRGYYYEPHLIRGIGEKGKPRPQYLVKHKTLIDPENYEPIINGMEAVVNQGTVWSKARMQSVIVCGKTGTSQNAKGKDHSIFIGFAPKDNPKIAVAVFVEYAGFGGFVAAPIGTLMIEKFLNDTISRKNLEKHMISQDFIHRKRSSEDIKADSARKAKIRKDTATFMRILKKPETPITSEPNQGRQARLKEASENPKRSLPTQDSQTPSWQALLPAGLSLNRKSGYVQQLT